MTRNNVCCSVGVNGRVVYCSGLRVRCHLSTTFFVDRGKCEDARYNVSEVLFCRGRVCDSSALPLPLSSLLAVLFSFSCGCDFGS